MRFRNDFILDNAINAYEHTLNSTLDRYTLNFLKELREYRKAEEQGSQVKNDLISRSRLLSSINKRYNEKCNIVPDNLAEGFMQMEKLIKEQPTAYNINKVVENVSCRCYELGLDESQTELITNEILKQDNVSDYACEWKSASDGEFIQNPHTKRLYSNEPSMKNIYCNTCGKKIKVVE